MADVRTSELVINKLSKQQYENIQNPDPNQLYLVPEDEELDPHRVIEFQVPTAENNYTWYRKYADGWVEQGTILSNVGVTPVNFYFPIIFIDTNYFIELASHNNSTSIPAPYIRNFGSNFCSVKSNSTVDKVWVEVKGMYATE